METWRELALRLFPSYRNLYAEDGETISSVLSDQLSEALNAHRSNDVGRLEAIYGFAAWCYQQRKIEPELWRAAVPVFFEHLVDHPDTYRSIPKWIKPEIFEMLLPIFEHRLVDLPKNYGLVQPGAYAELLAEYDRVNGTDFAKRQSQS